MLAEVILNRPLRNAFTYRVPEKMQPRIASGMRVLVPFGKRREVGICVDFPRKSSIPAHKMREIESLLDEEAKVFDAATVGRKLKVLFERQGRKPGQIAGRSPYLQAVHGEDPKDLIGQIVDVDIVSAGPNSLTGVNKSGINP